MFEKIKKIIISTCSVIFVLIAALILLFLFGYRSEVSYTSPVWSKDGSRIYYIKNVSYLKKVLIDIIPGGWSTFKEKSYIMSMRPDGSGKRVITKYIRHIEKKSPLASIKDLAILPNNKELIFFLEAGIDPLRRTDEESGIYKVSIDGTDLVKLANFHAYYLRPPFFLSPDGTTITYTNFEIYKNSWSGQWKSSWLVDISGRNNHMICGEESKVEGWTKDGKIFINAYVNSEGNPKPIYDDHGYPIKYEYEVKDRYMLYDPSSQQFIKDIPQRFDKVKTLLKEDTNISPDGKKRLIGGEISIEIEDIDGKNRKILLKGKR